MRLTVRVKKGAAPVCGSFFYRKENRYATPSGSHTTYEKETMITSALSVFLFLWLVVYRSIVIRPCSPRKKNENKI